MSLVLSLGIPRPHPSDTSYAGTSDSFFSLYVTRLSMSLVRSQFPEQLLCE